MGMKGEEIKEYKDCIVKNLEGGKKMKVKELRDMVLSSMQLDVSNKKSKKNFKKTIQRLEEKEGIISLDADGTIQLTTSNDNNDEKKQKKKKKKKRPRNDDDTEKSSKRQRQVEKGKNDNTGKDEKEEENDDEQQDEAKSSNNDENKEIFVTEDVSNEIYNSNNPTRLFLGNLPFAVTEEILNEFLFNAMTHVKWITDKETGKFYGSAFCEIDNSKNSTACVEKRNGTDLMGRPIKIAFAPARPGDIWPPSSSNENNKEKNNNNGQDKRRGMQSEKPLDCVKLFMGNLNFDIDDNVVKNFFEQVDAQVKTIRWLHHRSNGEFKGCGYVEFWKPEACDRAATLNGKHLMGRPIRLDWTS